MDQLGPILVGAAALVTAAGSLELRRRGRAKVAEADAFRRLVLLRRVLLWLLNPDRADDPKLIDDITRETT